MRSARGPRRPDGRWLTKVPVAESLLASPGPSAAVGPPGGALQVASLGTVHCARAEAHELADTLALLAGGTAAEVVIPHQDAYLVPRPEWTIQLEREDPELMDSPGPFAGLGRWRCLLVAEMTPAALRVAARLRAQLRPFTRSELGRIRALNPMVAELAERHAGSRPLGDVNLVFRDHMLIEKYNLVAALRRCGLSPDRVLDRPKDRPHPVRGASRGATGVRGLPDRRRVDGTDDRGRADRRRAGSGALDRPRRRRRAGAGHAPARRPRPRPDREHQQGCSRAAGRRAGWTFPRHRRVGRQARAEPHDRGQLRAAVRRDPAAPPAPRRALPCGGLRRPRPPRRLAAARAGHGGDRVQTSSRRGGRRPRRRASRPIPARSRHSSTGRTGSLSGARAAGSSAPRNWRCWNRTRSW